MAQLLSESGNVIHQTPYMYIPTFVSMLLLFHLYMLLHFSIMCLHKELSNPCVYQWLLLGNQFNWGMPKEPHTSVTSLHPFVCVCLVLACLIGPTSCRKSLLALILRHA